MSTTPAMRMKTKTILSTPGHFLVMQALKSRVKSGLVKYRVIAMPENIT